MSLLNHPVLSNEVFLKRITRMFFPVINVNNYDNIYSSFNSDISNDVKDISKIFTGDSCKVCNIKSEVDMYRFMKQRMSESRGFNYRGDGNNTLQFINFRESLSAMAFIKKYGSEFLKIIKDINNCKDRIFKFIESESIGLTNVVNSEMINNTGDFIQCFDNSYNRSVRLRFVENIAKDIFELTDREIAGKYDIYNNGGDSIDRNKVINKEALSIIYTFTKRNKFNILRSGNISNVFILTNPNRHQDKLFFRNGNVLYINIVSPSINIILNEYNAASEKIEELFKNSEVELNELIAKIIPPSICDIDNGYTNFISMVEGLSNGEMISNDSELNTVFIEDMKSIIKFNKLYLDSVHAYDCVSTRNQSVFDVFFKYLRASYSVEMNEIYEDFNSDRDYIIEDISYSAVSQITKRDQWLTQHVMSRFTGGVDKLDVQCFSVDYVMYLIINGCSKQTIMDNMVYSLHPLFRDVSICLPYKINSLIEELTDKISTWLNVPKNDIHGSINKLHRLTNNNDLANIHPYSVVKGSNSTRFENYISKDNYLNLIK